jgi:hypothetical protein
MRQISQIADRLLSMVVPAAEAKATLCPPCSYTGLQDEDPGCPNGYIYQVVCWTWYGPTESCTGHYSWRCE